MSLRNQIIKLAYEHPELRKDLLPLVREGSEAYTTDEWHHGFAQLVDNPLNALMKKSRYYDGTGLYENILYSITGNTGYPKSMRKAVHGVLAAFQRDLLKMMDRWDAHQRKIGVDFHE